MSDFNVDQYFEDYYPYFQSLRKVQGYKILDVEIPINWDCGKLVKELTQNNTHVQTILTEQDDQNKMVAIVGSEKHHTFDLLFNRLQKVIKVNQEREEKNRLFKITVKKLENLFLNSNLDQLQKLVIDVDETPSIEFGEQNEINEQPIIHDDNIESDDDVLAAIAQKKEMVENNNE